MFRKVIVSNLFVAAILAAAVAAQANPVTIPMVTVGNPGNAAGPAQNGSYQNGQHYGAVAYAYQIGEYEVTQSQYCAFLNAVAASDGTTTGPQWYGLYNSQMGNPTWNGGIVQSGVSGSYTYSVTPGFENLPASNVSWNDAVRFANWMANGQPTGWSGGAPGVGTPTANEESLATDSGASYNLGSSKTVPTTVTRNANSAVVNAPLSWALPNNNEWFKAAYYDPTLNSGAGGYWKYATKSNSTPSTTWPYTAGGGSVTLPANIATDTGMTVQGTDPYSPARYAYFGGTTTTPVGFWANSPSAYGTFDQTGNAFEWSESIDGTNRDLLGGSAKTGGSYYYDTSCIYGYSQTGVSGNVIQGFRLVTPMSGDANGDGKVDGTDLNDVLSNYGLSSSVATGTWVTWSMGDFNGDGVIDGTDLNVVLSNYGAGTSATAAVPEPCALGMLVLGALGLLAYAWRKK